MSKKILAKVKKLNLKTIRFNLHYFPLKTAIKLPVFISANSKILSLKGKISIQAPIKTGMIELGYEHLGNFDKYNSRFIWDVRGEVIFERNASIGHGCRIRVLETGQIYFGENFVTTAETSFVSRKKISIGRNCLFSWEILLMDTDFHNITNEAGTVTNPDKEIIIGNNVWIGCRATVLKGAAIPDRCIVAAGSIVNRKLTGEQLLISGNPAAGIKPAGTWHL